MSTATGEGVNRTADYQVRRTKNSANEGIQHVQLESVLTMRQDDASATVVYYGWARAGTSESASSWKILRHTTTNPQKWEFADGDLEFNNSWASRASLSYS